MAKRRFGHFCLVAPNKGTKVGNDSPIDDQPPGHAPPRAPQKAPPIAARCPPRKESASWHESR